MKESTLSKQLRDDIQEYFDKEKMFVHVNLLPDMRRTGKKPYDFYVLVNRIFYAFELKVENGKSFAFDKVKPHQPGYLQEVIDAKGIGIFAICFPKEKCLFILAPCEWKKAKKKNRKQGKKSISFDYFYENSFRVDRKRIDGKIKWDINEIFKIIIINADRYKSKRKVS